MYTKFVLRASTTSNTRLGALNERLLEKFVSDVAAVRAGTGAGAGAGAGIVDATSGVAVADVVGAADGVDVADVVGAADRVDVADGVDAADDGGGGDGGACLVRARNNVDVPI